MTAPEVAGRLRTVRDLEAFLEAHQAAMEAHGLTGEGDTAASLPPDVLARLEALHRRLRVSQESWPIEVLRIHHGHLVAALPRDWRHPRRRWVRLLP